VPDPAKIGIISDTHGLLREQATAALEGSDLILHAGDVGSLEILTRLRTIAPVIAVRGNVDQGSWASELPLASTIESHGIRIYMLHNLSDLHLNPAAAGFHIVIAGHTHKPECIERNGVTYFNPGSAGPRRFHLPISLARLDLSVSPWKLTTLDLQL
jgi:uncharacterized protein